jgi:hypothetical protein
MRTTALVLGLSLGILAAGCGYPALPALGGDSGTGGANGDGANGDGSSSCPTGFASLLDTCALAFDGDLMLSGTAIVYDTTTHMLTVDGATRAIAYKTITISGDEVDVLAARNVQLAATSMLTATGTRPLAIVASGSVTVATDALIQVGRGGAGAQSSCPNGATMGGASSANGGGGGGGGGYGADGGNGGNGDNNNGAGGAKGQAVSSIPAGLRGGCPGAAGGRGAGGAGGVGAGALYLVAATRIQLDGVIDAGGDGGGGGLFAGGGNAGGGGGGSGGMVILEAPHITGTGVVAANGGAGGGGSNDIVTGRAGNPGSVATTPAAGGAGAVGCTDGGVGGSKAAPSGATVATTAVNAGGGGGGGVGIIRILSSDVQLAVISPDPR